MDCPFCAVAETKVIDSRYLRDSQQTRRRRECLGCQGRFTTYESIAMVAPRVVKRDGRYDTFSTSKLRSGMLRALEKRPITVTQLDAAIAKIMRYVYSCAESEISATRLGQLAMAELRQLDQVAYLRFASVYCDFGDVTQFQEAVDKLKEYETI
jgi:transcriptional repressor NrdR